MKQLSIFGLLVLILSGCNIQKTEKSNCEFLTNIPDGQIQCGTLEVPENYKNPQGKSITIAYAILKAEHATSKYPVIHLAGGPGGEALYDLNRWIDNPIREERDFIVFDQRGVGYSSPLPDIRQGIFGILAANLSIEEEYSQVYDTMQRYQQIAIEKGIAFDNYTTINNAADVNSLMQHLGYEKYVLYGESYGTRLARFVMDQFPERINSVILDSPATLEKDFLSMRLVNFSEALEKLFVFCENDESCNIQYPNIREDYIESIEALAKNPIEATIAGQSFFINPQDAIYLLRYQLYGSDAKTSTFSFINALKVRDTAVINASNEFLVNVIEKGNLSMFITTERYEEYDETLTELQFDSLYKNLPHLPSKLALFSSTHKGAKEWLSKTITPEEKTYGVLSIPTLIFVNQFDPVTPPQNIYVFEKSLKNAHLFVLDLTGHGVSSGCETRVMINFMNTPDGPFDSECLTLLK
ncbi:MAG TPA: alpha/beta hydrolase [Cytophagales bacterium]|nr:alpha/beta hydrolase [Cytophagales bacterium]HCR54924.1 alpha/beta hydrolase [Cytophagales bacterium]